MSVTALDSSILVAASLGWHRFHAPAHDALVASRRNRGGRLVLPAPALVEAYAVMTRLPAPHRMSPDDARAVLSRSFEAEAGIVNLTGRGTWVFLHASAEGGIAGGRTYDALILECARKAGATRLLTLDRRDFGRLGAGDVEIVVP